MPAPLPPWTKRDNLSVPPHQRLVDGHNSLSLMTGSGDVDIVARPNGRAIVHTRPEVPLGVVPIMIDNWSQDGTNKRWRYTWHVPRKLLSGYPAGVSPTDAWSSTVEDVGGHSSTYGYAYNGAETVNAAVAAAGAGPYGNGVVKAHLDAVPNLDVQPVTPGTIHLALIIYPEDGGLPEAWFNSPNGVSGPVNCP
jgi:hypothetical protein